MSYELQRLLLARSEETSWRRCAHLFLAAMIGMLAVSFLFILLVDPFDRGRPPGLLLHGIFDESPRTANVSRGRDPRFDAAIFGNSHIQLLDPHRLSTASNLNFVQMSTPGTGPRETVSLMNWFIRNHAIVRAMVVGVDNQTCTQDRGLPLANPFPFWLYGDDFDYMAHVLSSHSIGRGWKRILLATGVAKATDPAGYWNYEEGRVWDFRPPRTMRQQVDLAPVPSEGLKFPWLDQIESTLAQLSTETRILLVMPPHFAASLPASNSKAARDLAACKQEILRRAMARHWVFLDFLLDNQLSRDPENFWDPEHIRMGVARIIEERVVGEVRSAGLVR
jgi:hypothetical protein